MMQELKIIFGNIFKFKADNKNVKFPTEFCF